MIKINLLPQRRAKRAGVRRAASDPSAKHLLVGVIGLVAAAAPWCSRRSAHARPDSPSWYRRRTRRCGTDLQRKSEQLVGYAELQKAAGDADERRTKSIKRLLAPRSCRRTCCTSSARSSLRASTPTMTDGHDQGAPAAAQTGDPNKRFQHDWDASHVWLSGFTDTSGAVQARGRRAVGVRRHPAREAARGVGLLQRRHAAGGERVADSQTGANYYKFTITGQGGVLMASSGAMADFARLPRSARCSCSP